MDLEKQRGQRAKEKIARSSPKSYYSRHESHHPSYYPHYEGFRDEHDNYHHEHGHHHHRHYKHSHYHQGHHEHDHHHQEHHDHGYKLNKHKGENPVSVSICIIPRKPKGKFYAPSVCGNYDLEKNKVCIQLPEKHCKKSERSEDRMSCHNHRKLDQDYANKRYSCLETRSQDHHGGKSHYRSSSTNGAMPHCVGFIGGIQLCGPVNYGNAPGRLWRGSCC
ncbi:unnamed protein product [Larinioides sclopetarius]|uniref:Histidine-rich glycoprotein-like n=1 Tax=Larinioides sclopetarius TaxID=280406 RepID=A0AAV1ZIF6_9ARAC